MLGELTLTRQPLPMRIVSSPRLVVPFEVVNGPCWSLASQVLTQQEEPDQIPRVFGDFLPCRAAKSNSSVNPRIATSSSFGVGFVSCLCNKGRTREPEKVAVGQYNSYIRFQGSHTQKILLLCLASKWPSSAYPDILSCVSSSLCYSSN